VQVSGTEVWKMGASDLIASSESSHDADADDHQIASSDQC
jgi:hypothetical protein